MLDIHGHHQRVIEVHFYSIGRDHIKTHKLPHKITVNYPAHRAGHLERHAHRAGHLERQGGGLHPPFPCSAFIPAHRAEYSAGFS